METKRVLIMFPIKLYNRIKSCANDRGLTFTGCVKELCEIGLKKKGL